MARRALIAGNWKMNGLRANLDWTGRLKAALNGEAPGCEVTLCPPATLMADFARDRPDWLALGGQDCSMAAAGAHTGEIAAGMLADLGAAHVIVGHSERRAMHGETSVLVKRKADAALAAGLIPIICVGETLEEREAGRAEEIVAGQVRESAPDTGGGQVVIAYEPVWAIGTGRTASADDAQAMHRHIRNNWPGMNAGALRIVYGGSVKPGNAAALMAGADVDGALVGGASLDPEAFAAIVRAA